MVIYLSSNFTLGISEIGLVVGGAMLVGSLLSLYGGYLTDKISSYRLNLSFTGFFTVGFIGMCLTSHLWLFFLFLVSFNFAYSVIDIVVKAAFGKLLPEAERGKVFSVRYTVINIGYAVGPFIGAGLAHTNNGAVSRNRRKQYQYSVQAEVFDYIEQVTQALLREQALEKQRVEEGD